MFVPEITCIFFFYSSAIFMLLLLLSPCFFFPQGRSGLEEDLIQMVMQTLALRLFVCVFPRLLHSLVGFY